MNYILPTLFAWTGTAAFLLVNTALARMYRSIRGRHSGTRLVVELPLVVDQSAARVVVANAGRKSRRVDRVELLLRARTEQDPPTTQETYAARVVIPGQSSETAPIVLGTRQRAAFDFTMPHELAPLHGALRDIRGDLIVHVDGRPEFLLQADTLAFQLMRSIDQ